ncbi:hypothetical protein [Leisingera sp. NJS204]|uniref:hypothetical protein n=1 Tax=Leisingera sp. NJS204 TaxID=2508307 RepID=UPI001012A15F|nr:hypothetical protein [Leisingera sp. NJS204]QAX28723.1 hypothetical protein ETW24_04655 [Leisingera sp. NJS204]
MNNAPQKNLLEQQVELTRLVLDHREGMQQHLISRVLPHLGEPERTAVEELVEFLDEEDSITPDLAYNLDTVLAEIRMEIAAGTTAEQVAIPRAQLIGCAEAFDTCKSVTPAAEVLQAALPAVEQLYQAVRNALNFAEAVKLSLRMFDEG